MVRIVAVLHADEADQIWEALHEAARQGGKQARQAAEEEAARVSAESSAPSPSSGAASQRSKENPNEASRPAGVSAETPAALEDGPPPLAEVWDLELRAAERAAEFRAVNEASETVNMGQLRLPDALAWMAERMLEGRLRGETGGDRYELQVLLEPDAVTRDGYPAALSDGTPVPAETLRRMACDAGLVPTLIDEAGHPLDVGRKQRTIPAALRRALQARDRTCVFPGCGQKRGLHAHHREHWAHGGETNLDNLCLLCGFHHKLVHEGGWTLGPAPGSGAFVFYRPDGRRFDPVPKVPDVRARVTSLQEQNEARGLSIDAETNDPRWDGTTPDYSACVAALM
jgi:hypothetical protein